MEAVLSLFPIVYLLLLLGCIVFVVKWMNGLKRNSDRQLRQQEEMIRYLASIQNLLEQDRYR
ncbi:hypothetical protein ACFFJY_15040 [Fictibacillus aquaticus]|uniref:DUF4083 domain-containing protein n=1 Tax=Fictibacillus aquaticus TaxID=2021314 RepID=A0A235FEA6_9BACL|nr:hypothetical protein [Fictibacillus aquaticus]OYD59529.1 hypothetical protein CGZ90_06455 [Fictibacillus aquaticus]